MHMNDSDKNKQKSSSNAARCTHEYNRIKAIQITGNLNLQILSDSISSILERHEILRSNFTQNDGELQQVVHENKPYEIESIDLSSLSPDELVRQLQSLILAEARTAFDLEKDALIRIKLLHLGSTDHILIVNMHNIVSDDWSLNIFLSELCAIYSTKITGSPISLPMPEYQFIDYAVWQERWFKSEDLSNAAEYWTARLAGSMNLEFPADFPRPAVFRHTGTKIPFILTKELTKALESVAKNHNATLFMVLLTAYNVLLSRYTRHDDVNVGISVANRDHAEFASLIGCFVNTVVLRSNIDRSESFIDLLNKIKVNLADAMKYQEFSFDKVVDLLKIEPDLSRTPVFQAMFIFQDMKTKLDPMANVTVTLLDIDDGISQTELVLDLYLEDDHVKGSIKFSTDLFEKASILRFRDTFVVFLENIVENLTEKLGLLRLTLQQDLDLIHRWNSTDTNYGDWKTLQGMFAAQVAKTPDAIALEFEDESLTYAQLDAKSSHVANWLIRQGVDVERSVGVCMYRSMEMTISMLGILKAGCAYLPLDPSLPAHRLEYILENSDPNCILCQSDTLASLPKMEKQFPTQIVNHDYFHATQLEDQNPKVKEDPKAVAYIIYTSGSTGKPKGVMVPQEGIVNRILWMQEVYQMDGTDAVLQKTPFTFDVSVWEFFWPILVGSRLVMARPEGHKDRDYLIDIINQKKITVLHFVPSMLRIFLDAKNLGRCQCLRKLMCSGEALNREDVKRFFEAFNQVELHNLYGPTEASVDVTWWHCKPEDTDRAVPIGRPIANTQMYVLDQDGQQVPIGVIGELYIGGIQLAKGYLNRPDLTAAAFMELPIDGQMRRVYKTGDLGRFRTDGAIDYLGRIDHQVKLRGLRIELGEIETVIKQQPGVKESVVLVRKEGDSDERLVGYVEMDIGKIWDEPAVRTGLMKDLPEYMIPNAFVIVNEWPVTANGKLDRNSLPSIESQKEKDSPQHNRLVIAPRDQWERTLLEIWEDILNIRPLSVTDNLFSEMGASSLAAMRAVNEIREVLQKNIQAEILLQEGTVERQAKLLKQTDLQAGNILVSLKSNGDKPAIFLVHAAGGSAFHYTALARAMGNDRPVHVLQDPAYFSDVKLPDSIDEMAANYLNAIRAVQPKGPYYVGGWSLGGKIAFEMANQLIAAGEKVGLLLMFDTGVPIGTLERSVAKFRRSISRTALMLMRRFPNLAKKLGYDPKKLSQLDRLSVLAYLDMDKNLPELISFLFPGAYKPEQFKGMSSDQIWEQVFLAAKDQEPGLVVPGFDAASTRRSAKLFAKHHEVDNKYMPKGIYQNEITMFMAGGTNNKNGWNRYCKKPMQIHEFDIKPTLRIHNVHNAMMERENIPLFLEDFLAVLEAADQKMK